MTDKTKLVAIARTDDMSALEALAADTATAPAASAAAHEGANA